MKETRNEKGMLWERIGKFDEEEGHVWQSIEQLVIEKLVRCKAKKLRVVDVENFLEGSEGTQESKRTQVKTCWIKLESDLKIWKS